MKTGEIGIKWARAGLLASFGLALGGAGVTALSLPSSAAPVSNGTFVLSLATAKPGATVTARSVTPCPKDTSGIAGVGGGVVSLKAPKTAVFALSPGHGLAADGAWAATLVIPSREPAGSYQVVASCVLALTNGSVKSVRYRAQSLTVSATGTTATTTPKVSTGGIKAKTGSRFPLTALVAVLLALLALVAGILLYFRNKQRPPPETDVTIAASIDDAIVGTSLNTMNPSIPPNPSQLQQTQEQLDQAEAQIAALQAAESAVHAAAEGEARLAAERAAASAVRDVAGKPISKPNP